MTIALEVRDWSSADIPNVWDWKPDSADQVYFQLEIEVAEVGQAGGNLFQLVVATKEGIDRFKAMYPDANPYPQGITILENYSWQAVVDRLTSDLRECSLDSWHESIQCLSKKFLWEYEGYESE